VYSKNRDADFEGTMNALAASVAYNSRMMDPTLPVPAQLAQQHVPSPPSPSPAKREDDDDDEFIGEPFDRETAKAIIEYDDLCTKPWKDLLGDVWPLPPCPYELFRPGRSSVYSAAQLEAQDRATADAVVGFHTNLNVLSLRMTAWKNWIRRPAPPNGRNIFFLGLDEQFRAGPPAPPKPRISEEQRQQARVFCNRTKGLRGGGGVVAGPSRAGRTARFDPLSRAGRRRNDANTPSIDLSLPHVAAPAPPPAPVPSPGPAHALPPSPAPVPAPAPFPAPAPVSPPVPVSPPAPCPRPPCANKRADPLAPRKQSGVTRRPPKQLKKKKKAVDHRSDDDADSGRDGILQSVLKKRLRKKTSPAAPKPRKSEVETDGEEEEPPKQPAKKKKTKKTKKTKKKKGADADAKALKKGPKEEKQPEVLEEAPPTPPILEQNSRKRRREDSADEEDPGPAPMIRKIKKLRR
jgi:hypothetical protein